MTRRTTGKYVRPLNKYRQAHTAEEYLDQRLDKSGECWVWTSGADRNGYGQCHAARVAKDLGGTRAHQLAYVAAYGSVPEGRIVCHTCDNPSCCNPKHLYAGTHKDNVRDCVERGRHTNGAAPQFDHDYAISQHGKKTSLEVAKELGVTFSAVCHVWRKNGLTGRAVR